MVLNQDTLIYIEENDKIEAGITAKGFADEETKSRAYINALGAELALKYLTSENINVSNIYNMHSIRKVLEETDISDIMLPNIHIDVRVIFDENFIFIPKSHFEYNVTPDIYLVFKLAEDSSHVNFLGFFEPKLINKNNANDKYYFIEKEKLSSPVDLKNYITNFKGNTEQILPENELENSERIMISMVDNDITETDKKYLLQQLTKCAELRDKFIEYENFELLSYRALTDNDIQKREYTDTTAKTEEILPVSGFNDLNKLEEIQDLSTIVQDENASSVDVPENIESTENITTPIDNTELNVSDLESVPEIDDILADTQDIQASTNETPLNNITEHNIAETITNVAELGAEAALSAGAGAAAMAAGEAVSNIASGMEIAKEGLEIIDKAIDLDAQIPESISFDDVDTTEIDNKIAESVQENTISDTISFDNIDTDNLEEKPVDFINEIDNKISLDNIELSEDLSSEPQISSAETMSFNNIDTSEMDNINLKEEIIPDETLSFDNVDTSNIKIPEIDLDNEKIDNTISFEDVKVEEMEDEEPKGFVSATENFDSQDLDADFLDTSMSFDDSDIDTVEMLDTVQSPEISNMSKIELSPEPIEDTVQIDDMLDTTESISDSSEIPEITELSEPVMNIQTETDMAVPEISESEKTESFGKNLMEGLSEDNLEDISIENLGDELNLPETDSMPNAEDISSNDLLAEIDNILNAAPEHNDETSSKQAVAAPENFETAENDMPDTAIEDLLGIDALDELSLASPQEQTIQNNNSFDDSLLTQSSLPQESAPDDIASLIDQVETNYINDAQSENNNSSFNENEEKLGVLFNDSDEHRDEDNINTMTEYDAAGGQSHEDISDMPVPPGVALYNRSSSSGSKKTILVAAAIVAVLASASVFAFLKSKNGDANIDNVAQNTNEAEVLETPQTPASTETTTPAAATDENVLTNAPDINSIDNKEVQKAKSSKELKNTAKTVKSKSVSSESYLSVQKLVWDVPDYLSYSNKMKNYLMTAGKSIKLSLSADLLLATEYAYSNQVKVSMKLSNDGTVQDAKIVSSSGSKQIDDIVLQSVKDTLNVVKPPAGEVKGSNFNLSLIIYL